MEENKNPGRNDSKTTDQPSEKTNEDFNNKAPQPNSPDFKERKPKAEVENVAEGGKEPTEAKKNIKRKNDVIKKKV